MPTQSFDFKNRFYLKKSNLVFCICLFAIIWVTNSLNLDRSIGGSRTYLANIVCADSGQLHCSGNGLQEKIGNRCINEISECLVSNNFIDSLDSRKQWEVLDGANYLIEPTVTNKIYSLFVFRSLPLSIILLQSVSLFFMLLILLFFIGSDLERSRSNSLLIVIGLVFTVPALYVH